MARASLLLVSMGLAGQSCLISATPELNPPVRTTPQIKSVLPPTYQIQQLPSLGASGQYTTTIEFSFVSEDLGQDVYAIVYFDFAGYTPIANLKPYHQVDLLPAGHSNVVRHSSKTFDFPSDTTSGCHSVTLVLTHQVDFVADNQHFKPVDTSDTDQRTWWYELGTGPVGQVELSTCAAALAPNTDGGAPDGGGDGGTP
jgi:hypothetical protein